MLDPVLAAQIVVDAMILARVRGLRVLGDVPGHEFHGNQWIGYHGTTKENAEKILKEGLKPDKRGDIWTTTNLIEAKTYARAAGNNSVVLNVRIPADDTTKYDERKSTKTLRVYKEPLPAKYVSMHSTHVSGGPFGEWLKTLGDAPGHPFHGNQWTNAAHATAAELSGVTPDAPLKTYKAYHVTKKENAAAILAKGFDITKVKPRWQNDYAVSLSRGAKAATDYFSKVDPTTMKPVGMDTKKYSLLEVTVKGRLFKGEAFQRAPVGYASSAKDWTHQLVHTHGYDGQDQGHTIFVNNPKSIVSVREVSPKVKTLGGSGSGNFGHAGRPGEVGGSADNNAAHVSPTGTIDYDHLAHGQPPALAAAIQREGEALFHASFDGPVHENLTFINATTGQPITPMLKGELMQVVVPEDVSDDVHAATARGDAVISMHTHPSGSPFSRADFDQTIASNLTGAIVLGKDGSSYELRIKNPPLNVFDIPMLRDDLGSGMERARKDSLALTDQYAQKQYGYDVRFDAQTNRAQIAREHPEIEHVHRENWSRIATKAWQDFADNHINSLSFRYTPPKTDVAGAHPAPITVKAAAQAHRTGGYVLDDRETTSVYALNGAPLGSSRALGGTGSGNFGHAGRPGEVGGSGAGSAPVRSEKSRRALKNFVPAYAAAQRQAEQNELTVRSMVGGTRTQGNAPVDVVVTMGGKVKGIEVKTLISNTNDKITVRKSAMEKKDQWAHANHASVHTVVLDDREKGHSPLYYAKGHGSFRISAMTPVRDADHLKKLLMQ